MCLMPRLHARGLAVRGLREPQAHGRVQVERERLPVQAAQQSVRSTVVHAQNRLQPLRNLG
jgi:hypothetical protein